MNESIIKNITKLFISRNITPIDGLCDIWHDILIKYSSQKVTKAFAKYIPYGDDFPSLPKLIKIIEDIPDDTDRIKRLMRASWKSIEGPYMPDAAAVWLIRHEKLDLEEAYTYELLDRIEAENNFYELFKKNANDILNYLDNILKLPQGE